MNGKYQMGQTSVWGAFVFLFILGCGDVDDASSQNSANRHSDTDTPTDSDTPAKTENVDTGISGGDTSVSAPIMVSDCTYPNDYEEATIEYSYLWSYANELGYDSLNRNQDGCQHEDVTCLEYPGTVVRSMEGWRAVFGGDQPLLTDIEGETIIETVFPDIDWNNTTLIVTPSGGGGMGSWRMEPRFHHDTQNHLHVTVHVWQPVVPEMDTDIGWNVTTLMRVENDSSPVELEVQYLAPCSPADVEPLVSAWN